MLGTSCIPSSQHSAVLPVNLLVDGSLASADGLNVEYGAGDFGAWTGWGAGVGVHHVLAWRRHVVVDGCSAVRRKLTSVHQVVDLEEVRATDRDHHQLCYSGLLCIQR